MVPLAPRSPSRRTRGSHQIKNATVVLGAPHQQSDRAAQHGGLRRLALGAETAGQIGQRRRKPVARFALRRVRQGFRGDTASEPALNLPLGGKLQPEQCAPQRPDVAVGFGVELPAQGADVANHAICGAAASAAAANPSPSRSRPYRAPIHSPNRTRLTSRPARPCSAISASATPGRAYSASENRQNASPAAWEGRSGGGCVLLRSSVFRSMTSA